MNNIQKLELLEMALMDGATSWRLDEGREELTAWYNGDYQPEGVHSTIYKVDHRDTGDWLIAHDWALPGFIETGWCVCGQSRA